VDRISAVLPNSKNIDSHMGKSGNSEHPVQPAQDLGQAQLGEIK
jgi:hypothetical protein